jgi:hypothetical protein
VLAILAMLALRAARGCGWLRAVRRKAPQPCAFLRARARGGCPRSGRNGGA